jgi:hypothetical protein
LLNIPALAEQGFCLKFYEKFRPEIQPFVHHETSTAFLAHRIFATRQRKNRKSGPWQYLPLRMGKLFSQSCSSKSAQRFCVRNCGKSKSEGSSAIRRNAELPWRRTGGRPAAATASGG